MKLRSRGCSRSIGFGTGTAYLYGFRFGATYRILSTLGQMVAYGRGVRPGMEYKQKKRPHISWVLVGAAVVRTIGYTMAGLVSGLVAHKESQVMWFGIEAGLVIGVATAFGGFVSPYVEWWADNLPERRLGAFGIILILIGFALGSAEHWATLLDVQVR
jgi:Kef-type K+ transport system membrane component KefB